MPRTQEGLTRLIAREGVSQWVVDAFKRVDRAGFVPVGTDAAAYADRPVGLPRQQTTSQPSLIARMISELELAAGAHVLEVGTGFGFQTALLACRASRVVSVERHAELSQAARRNLDRAGFANVELVVGDGWEGEPVNAPYDGAVVSATAPQIPAALESQLRRGGRLVIPLAEGSQTWVQTLVKVNGGLRRVRAVTPARFVPLVASESAPAGPGRG